MGIEDGNEDQKENEKNCMRQSVGENTAREREKELKKIRGNEQLTSP